MTGEVKRTDLIQRGLQVEPAPEVGHYEGEEKDGHSKPCPYGKRGGVWSQGRVMVARMRISVDFPAPLGPRRRARRASA